MSDPYDVVVGGGGLAVRCRERTTGVELMLVVSIVVAAGCGDAGPNAWGETVDPAAAVPLSELLSGDGNGATAMVTTSGRIGEVCRASGCWFVLQDVADERLYEVFVDLKPEATFVVPSSVRGREAVVRGKLVGEKPDLRLDAVGLMLE